MLAPRTFTSFHAPCERHWTASILSARCKECPSFGKMLEAKGPSPMFFRIHPPHTTAHTGNVKSSPPPLPPTICMIFFAAPGGGGILGRSRPRLPDAGVGLNPVVLPVLQVMDPQGGPRHPTGVEGVVQGVPGGCEGWPGGSRVVQGVQGGVLGVVRWCPGSRGMTGREGSKIRSQYVFVLELRAPNQCFGRG